MGRFSPLELHSGWIRYICNVKRNEGREKDEIYVWIWKLLGLANGISCHTIGATLCMYRHSVTIARDCDHRKDAYDQIQERIIPSLVNFRSWENGIMAKFFNWSSEFVINFLDLSGHNIHDTTLVGIYVARRQWLILSEFKTAPIPNLAIFALVTNWFIFFIPSVFF